MVKTEHISQREINSIWRREWLALKGVNKQKTFNHRLFVEGYAVFKKYIPNDAEYILDSGGGTGRYGLKIAQDFPRSNVIISDILEESLDLGKETANELKIKNVQFKNDDVTNSSFPDNKFDVVLSDVVLQHLPDYLKGIEEIRRITKPGGTIVIAVVNYWNFHTLFKGLLKLSGRKYEYGYEKSFSEKELAEAIKKEGLKIVAADGFHVGYGLFRLKKYHRIFRFLGRAVNRLSKMLDGFTHRFFSRKFGFEIVVVAQK